MANSNKTILSASEKLQLKQVVIDALEKYRIYKFIIIPERESRVTPSYDERFHGPTGVTSDQTASIAVMNVDAPAARKAYCDRIDSAVNRLPAKERELVTIRYLSSEADYITDQNVYDFKLDTPVNKDTYDKIRIRAFSKLALMLDLDCRISEEKLIRIS